MRDGPPPVVHAAAPLRVDLAGSGGLAALAGKPAASLSLAVDRVARAEVRLGGRTMRLGAVETGEHLALTSPADLTYDGCLDRHKAALRMLPVTGGLELLTSRDAPEGAGLGGGTACLVAMLAALAHCRRERMEPEDLVDLAVALESDELGRHAPVLDLWSTVCGGLLALTVSEGDVTVESFDDDAELARALAARLVIAPLDRARAGGLRGRAMIAALEAGDAKTLAAVAELDDLVDTATGALRRRAWADLAEVFRVTFGAQQRLDPVLGAAPAEAVIGDLRAAGALAWKVTSGRRGASLVALCEPERREAVAAALRDAGCAPFSPAAGQAVRVWEEAA